MPRHASAEQKDADRRLARGYKIDEFARREGVAPSTVKRWIDKGAVNVSRLAPRSGVRVDYPEAHPGASRRI